MSDTKRQKQGGHSLKVGFLTFLGKSADLRNEDFTRLKKFLSDFHETGPPLQYTSGPRLGPYYSEIDSAQQVIEPIFPFILITLEYRRQKTIDSISCRDFNLSFSEYSPGSKA
jgi:hypothetical protein